MKTVFTDLSTIAHLWANQQQDNARNSGSNFYFNGSTIYSYGSHFPIAKHVENSEGVKAVLLTERTYSVTTAKHIRIVQHAASHKNLIYCYDPESTHEQNFNAWKIDAENEAAYLPKAKKPEKYLVPISHIGANAEKYAAFWGIEIPQDLKDVLSIGNKEQYAQYVATANERKAKAEKAAQAKLKAQIKADLKKWLSGESYRMYNRLDRDYLRMSQYDGKQIVETSQGVKIELPEAKRLFAAIVARTLKAGDKVSHQYEVAKINGDLVVGCHTFPTKYLIQFGQKNLK